MDGQDYYDIGERWGCKFAFHRDILNEVDLLNKTKNTQILDLIVQDVFFDNDEKRIKGRLSDIGRYFKIMGDNNKYFNLQKEGDYINFINLEMFGDYASSDINEASQGLDRWLLIKKEINCSNLIKKRFFRYFDKYLDEFFQQQKPYSIKRQMHFKDFINEVGCWSTEGSSGASLKNIEQYSKFKGYIINNKKIFGLLMNKEKLFKMVEKRKKQRMKVNIKRELVKSRGVVNSDVETYLLMAYINFLCEGTLYGSQSCTLLQKDTDSKKLFLDNMNKNLESDQVNLPLDQSAFDAQVDFDMIDHCFKNYKKYCSKFFSKENNDLEIVFEQLEGLIMNGDVILGDKKIKYQNGIPSGWRWTSLFDSAINFAQCKTIEHLLQDMDYVAWVKDLTVQGDDVQCIVNSKYTGELMIALFDHLGMEINRKKMFIDTKRSEYLRLKYSRVNNCFVIRGIPARTVPTLFFRSPITSDQMSLNSLLDQWLKLIRRYEVYDSKHVFSLMIKDCYKFINSKKMNNKQSFIHNQKYKRIFERPEKLEISEYDIRNYIFTPSSLGGYGLGIKDMNCHYNELKHKTCILKSYEQKKYRNDIVRDEIQNIKDLASKIVIENNLKWNQKSFLRYINEECNWYGENRRYIYYHDTYLENKIDEGQLRYSKNHKKYRIQKRNIILPIDDIMKSLNIKDAKAMISLNVNRTIISPIYRDKTYELSVDSNDLYNILKEHTDTSYENRELNGWFIDEKSQSFKKWKESSTSFRNRILLDNESFTSHYKNLFCGMNIHNLLIYSKVNIAINSLVNICKWTGAMLSKTQRISSQYTVDTRFIRSSE